MFDVTLQIMAADVAPGEEIITLVFIPAFAIPIGPGQMMPVQGGWVRIPMRKESAIDYANKIIEEAEKLPDTPTPQQKSADILLASNMSDVQHVARQAQQFRGQ